MVAPASSRPVEAVLHARAPYLCIAHDLVPVIAIEHDVPRGALPWSWHHPPQQGVQPDLVEQQAEANDCHC